MIGFGINNITDERKDDKESLVKVLYHKKRTIFFGTNKNWSP